MKKKYLVIALLCAPLLSANAQRDTLSLNRDWMFRPGVPEPSTTPASTTLALATEDRGWRKINIPHDFQIEQPWVSPDASEKGDLTDISANIKSRLSARGFKEMGEGWYVKAFTPSRELKGKRLLLNFEGIMYVGDIYLNGELVGSTDYGYLGFEIDVTDKLKFDEANTIAVRAETGEPRMSRWYTGGGLFRGVSLIATDPNYYFVRHPLNISTTDNSRVSISAELSTTGPVREVKLHVAITDSEGNAVSDSTYKFPRNRNYITQEFQIPSITLHNPRLWDCEHPNLYLAKIELLRPDGSVADAVTKHFGVRTVEFVPNRGFLLNGEKVLLKGYANHHDLGALGAAAYPRAIEKRIKLVKEFGMNHIRSSHNPYSEDFLDLCDKYGILVVDELYDKWNDQYAGAGRVRFQDLWIDDVTEWVRRDRNHPCVIMWSLGNELQQLNNQPFNDFGVTQYKLMKTVVQRYDPTRKVTVAMHPRYRNWETNDLPCDLAMVTDVQSYNYRYMYFPGDGQKFPWMTFYQSEASISAMGENYFGMELDKVIGLAYWGAIDYLGESQGWPAKGWAQGVIDISLEPKPKAFYMKSFYSNEPLVHIAVTESRGNQMWNGVQTGNDGQSDHWNRTPGEKLEIITYTNAEEVELLVNGKSLGVKKNNTADPRLRNQILWQEVEYKAGNILAIARTGGREVARHKIETTGKAVSLVIESDNADWKADGQDLQHIRVIAVDSRGRRVKTAAGEVKCSVSGDATIAAVGNGNINSDELNVTDSQMLFNGSMLAILRAGTEASEIMFTATCPGLKPVSVKFTTGN